MEAFARTFKDIVENNVENLSIRVALAQKLIQKFKENERLRLPFEEKWLQAIRQVKGIYDPEVLEKIPDNSSKVYPKLTRSKVNMVLSRLNEMLFPDLDRNWEIEPTPVPRVTAEIAKKIKKSLIRVDPQTGAQILPTLQDLEKATADYAKASSEKMQTEMDDQLLEMKYQNTVAKPVLQSTVIVGHGVVKGPLNETRTISKWEPQGASFESVEKESLSPYFSECSVWDWYPDMTVVNPEDMQGAFERHVMSKHDLRKLKNSKGFNKEVITQFMTEHPNGNFTATPWEIKLRNLESGQLAKNVFESKEAATQNVMGENKYVVLEYWGWIDSTDLTDAVPDIEKVDGEVYANIWLLGDNIIRAVAERPAGGDIYKVTYYEKDKHSIFGEGLPQAMRHSQITISAASRMMLNNAAICSGPQFEINYQLITNEDIDNIYPMKVWMRRGMGVDAQYQGVRVYHIESHIDEYIKIIAQFKAFGDEETCLPTWMISEPAKSGNETAHGLSMRMGAMTISLKDLVRQFDEFTENIIGALYDWNMENNEKEDIKGDFKIKARGSTSLVMKEVRMQALNQFQTTLNDEDWMYIRRRDFLEEKVKANDLPIKLRTEEEAAEYRKSVTDQRAIELQYKTLEAQIEKDKSAALFNLSKTKEKSRAVQKMDMDEMVEDAKIQGVNSGRERAEGEAE